jgi:hypothetical protein
MPSEATSFCCSLHFVPDLTNTYAEPAPTPGAPTTAVSPEIDTDEPKLAPPVPSEATSFCCSLHTVPDLTNTYAEPARTPPDVSSEDAPTTSVSPETDTIPK